MFFPSFLFSFLSLEYAYAYLRNVKIWILDQLFVGIDNSGRDVKKKKNNKTTIKKTTQNTPQKTNKKS